MLALPKSERFFRSVASLCAIRGWVCQCSEILQTPGDPNQIYELISFSAHFLLHIFIFWSWYEGFVSRLTKSPIHQPDPTVPLISVENFVKSVENLSLACGNAVECLGKTQGKNKNCKGAWGMGHGAWGMGSPFPLSPSLPLSPSSFKSPTLLLFGALLPALLGAFCRDLLK